MRTDKERPEENTCRIVKGHRGMGVFLPVKTVSVLVNRWYNDIIYYLSLRNKWGLT